MKKDVAARLDERRRLRVRTVLQPPRCVLTGLDGGVSCLIKPDDAAGAERRLGGADSQRRGPARPHDLTDPVAHDGL